MIASGARGPGFNSRSSPFSGLDLMDPGYIGSRIHDYVNLLFNSSTWAHGVVVSDPLRMRKALGSNPGVAKCTMDHPASLVYGRLVSI